MTTDDNEESGFTLVEMLMAIMISGMIVGAIASACFVGLRLMNGQQRSLQQSNAENVMAHAFGADVQGACNPTLSSPTCPRSPNPSSQSGPACGATAIFAVDTFSSPTAAAADRTIAWVLDGSNLLRLT